MHIRQCCIGDLVKNKQNFLILLKQVLKSSINSFSEQMCELKYADAINYSEKQEIILIGAFQNDELLGILWAYERMTLAERRIYLNYLAVLPQCQRQGVAKKLFEELTFIAKNLNVGEIELAVTVHNHDAVAFYKKMDCEIERFQMIKKI